jgi:hypothetical protein
VSLGLHLVLGTSLSLPHALPHHRPRINGAKSYGLKPLTP